jgi:hypothetical protein
VARDSNPKSPLERQPLHFLNLLKGIIMKAIDLTGQVFNRLTVLKLDKVINHRYYWLCLCSCGNYKTIAAYSIKSSHTKSCGCLHKEISIPIAKSMNTSHDMSKSSEYK